MRTIWRREWLYFRDDDWKLVYGRRKVGKSFMLRRIKSDLYITITEDLNALVNDEIVEVERALKEALEVLRNDGKVIIDEFQRLKKSHWEVLSSVHPRGTLILSGSSLRVMKEVFDKRSPLLGLVLPIEVPIIRFADALLSLSDLKHWKLWSVVVRDPWIVPHVNLSKAPEEEIARIAPLLLQAAEGLIGEVFTEEERELTKVYSFILRTLSVKWKAKEIGALAYSKGLVSSITSVTSALETLSKMGLVQKIPLYKTKGAKYYYKHFSPLLSVLYYLAEKYAIDEFPRFDLVGEVRHKLALEYQFSVGELLAEAFGGRLAYKASNGDVDVIITDRKGRPLWAFEVKLGSCSKVKVERLREVAPKVGAVCEGDVRGVDMHLDSRGLLEIAKEVVKKAIENVTLVDE